MCAIELDRASAADSRPGLGWMLRDRRLQEFGEDVGRDGIRPEDKKGARGGGMLCGSAGFFWRRSTIDDAESEQ